MRVFNSNWFVVVHEADGHGAFWPIDNKEQSVRFDLVCANRAFIPNVNVKFPKEVEAILNDFGIECE